MRKEQITALAIHTDSFDWTRLERVRGSWRTVSSRQIGYELLEESEEEQNAATLPADVLNALVELSDPVTLCIGSEQVLFRCLTLPTTEPDEIESMAGLQLDNLLPLAPDEMSVGIEVLALEELSTRVLACAVPVEVLDRAVRLLNLPHRKVLGIDVGALALLRLLAEAEELLREGREVVLHEDSAGITIIILEDALPVIIRPTAIQNISDSDIMRELRLAMLEAEMTSGAAALTRITLVTDRADSQPLVDSLASGLGCHTRTLESASLEFLSKGAALRGTSDATLNLTPRSWQDAQAERHFRSILFRWTGAAILVWAACAAFLYGGPALLDHRAGEIDSRIRTLSTSSRTVRDIRNRVRMIQTYMDRELSPLETLRELCLLLPDGIEFSSFRYRKEDRRLSLQGSARSTPLVYEFKQKIDESQLFSESALVSGPTTNPRTRGADFELSILFREESP